MSGATSPSVASMGPHEDGQARPLPRRLLASRFRTGRLQAQKDESNRLGAGRMKASLLVTSRRWTGWTQTQNREAELVQLNDLLLKQVTY